MPRIAAIEQLLEERARRQFRVSVLFGVAIALLVFAVAYSIYVDAEQDTRINSVSVCAVRPDSPECRAGHANSVALTTHAEACFILAQGGVRCRKPLPEADVLKRRLTNLASTLSYEAVPKGRGSAAAGSFATPPAARTPELSGDGGEASPGSPVARPPRSPSPAPPSPTPSPKPPSPAPNPSPPPAPNPEPPAPSPAPAARPTLDVNLPVPGVCVNALGVRVGC